MTRVERGLQRLPTRLKNLVKPIADRLDRARVWWWRRRRGYEKPVPSLQLRARVGRGLSIGHFVTEGERQAGELRKVFAGNDAPIEPGQRMLDFGCGCCRILAHMPGIDGGLGPELHGCDVDSEAISWNRRQFPGAHFAVNASLPPLPFPPSLFDRIYSFSVFNHLPEAQQDAWLAEIARVLAPDGAAILTVLGSRGMQKHAAGTDTSHPRPFTRRLQGVDLESAGLVFLPYAIGRANRRDYPGVEGAFGLTFHSPQYVAEHWARFVRVVDYAETPGTMEQDLVLVRPI